MGTRREFTREVNQRFNNAYVENFFIGAFNQRFDNGYLVTVVVGSKKIKGVLYHVPTEIVLFNNMQWFLTLQLYSMVSHSSKRTCIGRPWNCYNDEHVPTL